MCAKRRSLNTAVSPAPFSLHSNKLAHMHDFKYGFQRKMKSVQGTGEQAVGLKLCDSNVNDHLDDIFTLIFLHNLDEDDRQEDCISGGL